MTYKEHISETLFRAYCSFGSAKSGASRSRYKSWEYCHIIFLQMHKKGYKALSEEDFDYLALNLAFFLLVGGCIVALLSFCKGTTKPTSQQ